MADKVTLDFENNQIIWDTDTQKGTESCPELAERKAAIFAAMGYETVDFSPAVDAMEALLNGQIGKEEFRKRLEDFGDIEIREED